MRSTSHIAHMGDVGWASAVRLESNALPESEVYIWRRYSGIHMRAPGNELCATTRDPHIRCLRGVLAIKDAFGSAKSIQRRITYDARCSAFQTTLCTSLLLGATNENPIQVTFCVCVWWWWHGASGVWFFCVCGSSVALCDGWWRSWKGFTEVMVKRRCCARAEDIYRSGMRLCAIRRTACFIILIGFSCCNI